MRRQRLLWLIVGGMVAVSGGLGLLLWVLAQGSANGPVPTWLVLPQGSRVIVSVWRRDVGPLYEGPVYYLRFRAPGQPSAVLERLVEAIERTGGFKVVDPPRSVTPHDLEVRTTGEAWLKRHLLPIRDGVGMVTVSRLHGVIVTAYAWSGNDGCLVEVIYDVGL